MRTRPADRESSSRRGAKYPAPRVSVVVPTLGRAELLERCLQALVQQELPPADYEVIVVDDGPGAETAALVESFDQQAGPRIIYVANRVRHGPAAARNLGWHAARGSIVAFTDDDCVPAPGWLRAGLAAFTDGVVGVSGKIVMPLPAKPTDYELNAAGLERAEFVTANCFYRREALQLAGGFDERFTSAWREDTDLFFQLKERGFRLQKEPRALVVHPVRPAAWGVSIRQQAKTRFNPLLYKKHPRLYRERLDASPRSYYGMVAALLLAILLPAAGRRRMAAAAAVVWLLATVDFARRRLRGTSKRPGHLAEMLVTSAVIPPLAVYWRLLGSLRYRAPFF